MKTCRILHDSHQWRAPLNAGRGGWLLALVLPVLLAGCGAPPVVSGASTPSPAQPPGQPAGPTRFEPDIERFEQSDRTAPFRPGGVVFVGSSSIRMWEDLAEDFAGTPVLNRGFGGSELEDVLHYLDRVVLRHAPRLVVVYAGENDLNSGKPPERVLEDFRTLTTRIHAALPQTRVGFISIKPSPSRWHLEPRMRAANALVREYTAADPRLFFVDVFAPMLDADGTPRRELFLEDMLHMNREGYRIWRAAIAPQLEQKVILITLDGLRWQELFGGADSALVRDPRFVRDTTALIAQFWKPDARQRRESLMPFFWTTIAAQGQLFGNRWIGSTVDVTNPHRFSYPGYNEILVGYHDERIDSNARTPNPNVTVLEYAARQPGFEGAVAAFGSWDVFPYIVNEHRSGIPVNAGFRPALGSVLSEREHFLNRLQEQIPSPWATVRFDAFTHHYAMEHLKRAHPRLLYIAFGETDDFAHDGRYDAYLRSALQTDRFVRELWEWVQSSPEYAARTTLLITTDHGRGEGEAWTRHGATVDGAAAIWVAALGPGVPALGEHGTPGAYYQNQIASTVGALLGLEYANERPVGSPLAPVLGR